MKSLKPLLFSTVFIVLFLILFASFASTNAQSDNCPTIVESALKTTEQVCSGTGRDQACYGNILVDAQAQPGFETLTFQKPGDIVDLVSLGSLRLSPMDVEQGIWGLARLELRANLAASQPKNITLLMFGDVQVDNAVKPVQSLDIINNVGDWVNVRLTPSEKAGIVGTLGPNQTVQAIGRLEDGSWLRVKLPDSGVAGWVYAPFFISQGEINTLAVIEAKAPHFEPMQAFYFTSGTDSNPPCSTVPASGMLIQTPEGVGKVTLLINEVKINIGSTVFFQAEPGKEMRVTTLEGAADVEANGVKYTAYAGTTVTVPLDENLAPSGAPNPPVPYEMDSLQTLPLRVLTEQVAVLPPMSRDQIRQQLTASSCVACNASDNSAAGNGGSTGSNGANADNGCPNCPVGGGNNSGDSGNSNSGDDCPGQSCNAPGQGGTCPGNSCGNNGNGNSNGGSDGNSNGGEDCPGQSCNAPGQGGTCPGNSCGNNGNGGGNGNGNGNGN